MRPKALSFSLSLFRKMGYQVCWAVSNTHTEQLPSAVFPSFPICSRGSYSIGFARAERGQDCRRPVFTNNLLDL